MAVFRVEKTKRLYYHVKSPFTKCSPVLKGQRLIIAYAVTA